MIRPAALVVALALGCGLGGERVDLSVAASTEAAIQESLRTHPDLVRSSLPVVTNANASSTLARQIQQGAPADLFLSADEAWADAVASELEVLDRIDLLTNTVVEVRTDHAARACTALGDPSHVPAGRYAEQGLRAAGRWPVPDPVPFPTGPAAAWAVANGDCAVGFVYASDALAAGLQPVATLDVRATYPLLLLHERGRAVFEALQGDAASQVFARHGFGRP
jgi:molybdate transport system substrate-binding protein